MTWELERLFSTFPVYWMSQNHFKIVISRCELTEYFVCKPKNLQIGSTKLDSLMANWTRGKPLETTGGRTRNSLLTEISDESHIKPASEFT